MDLAALMQIPHPPRLTGASGGSVGILGLTADSRCVRPGWLFAALPGTNADGINFVEQAVQRGAAAVLAPHDSGLPAVAGSVPVIVPADNNDSPRRIFADMAARFFPRQPAVIAAVTGTNGKTSVASFTRQIWSAIGLRAAGIGTLGVTSPDGTPFDSGDESPNDSPNDSGAALTTPDPVRLHRTLDALAADSITHLVLEASSHGLRQHRVDGVRVAIAAFTNLSRDHLDYHRNPDDYAAAKMELFSRVMAPEGIAVLDADSEFYETIAAVCRERGHRIISSGRNGDGIRLTECAIHDGGQTLHIAHDGTDHAVSLPLPGGFQVSNALVAAGIAIAAGGDPAAVFAALGDLTGVPGRLEKAADINGAAIYVDYAHTPDALTRVLTDIRPHVRNKLMVVFGCGGDRDQGKRPVMGRIARHHADRVFVTDDNPRGEAPSVIRRAIMRECPGAVEIGDRTAAIAAAIAALEEGDSLIVAGKGHETGQILADRTIPFCDRGVVCDLVRKAEEEKSA